MEVWLCVICSAVLTVSLLNVENGGECSALDKGWYAWSKVLEIAGLRPNESGVQDLMQMH